MNLKSLKTSIKCAFGAHSWGKSILKQKYTAKKCEECGFARIFLHNDDYYPNDTISGPWEEMDAWHWVFTADKPIS